MSKEGFSTVIEYPRKMEVGSVVTFQNKFIVISKITKIEPITETKFLVSGFGKVTQ
ncbi:MULTISPECIES: hypothetical protein [unclassified Paenibacillus]|uniref:hypothetical protein n=1 Tax=unclassified Paenibacillus TaxID=185978 RepID=UPI00020D784B|nr:MULTISPECIES: hypothetical protein [unclassified Paenibacillus]EGL19832.1 hypothetical protein HMPREF9413_4814 [Paenibacillus sp. HGF7]EPD81329.1 hypothetical protein HMPREF1207_05087 [Paenibacillus sp. HGH0039]